MPTSFGVTAANAFAGHMSKLLLEARISVQAASAWMKRYYDKTHQSVELKNGD